MARLDSPCVKSNLLPSQAKRLLGCGGGKAILMPSWVNRSCIPMEDMSSRFCRLSRTSYLNILLGARKASS